jgi:hypothetical protein
MFRGFMYPNLVFEGKIAKFAICEFAKKRF